MSNEITNVSAGKPNIAGSIYRAPYGTELPTSTATSLNEAFVCMGYAVDDGVKNSFSIDNQVTAWGGDVVLSERKDTFDFTLLEATNTEVLKVVYGDSNVSGTLKSGITVKANNNDTDCYSWVFDMVLRNNTLKRIVVPRAVVSSVGEVEYKDDTPISYPITLTALEDSDGQTHYEYISAAVEEA